MCATRAGAEADSSAAESAGDERVTELEIRIAYQEHTIAQLNEALISQQRQIDALVARAQMLEERVAQRFQQSDDAAPWSAEEERPPHY